MKLIFTILLTIAASAPNIASACNICVCECKWNQSGTVTPGIIRETGDLTSCSTFNGTQCGNGAGVLQNCVTEDQGEGARAPKCGTIQHRDPILKQNESYITF